MDRRTRDRWAALSAAECLQGQAGRVRARNLKPSFFTNDELAECAPLARILFAGLWCAADRAGRLEDRAKRIKAEILPYDACNVDKLLGELAARGFITRYEVDGARYIQIVNFEKHQDPHVKERTSTIPAPCEHRASTLQNPLTPFPDSGLLTPDSITPSEQEAKPEPTEPEPPDGVLPHVWRDWQRHRGKKLSREAVRRQTERLAELQATGHDPNAVILQSIERGWSGLFELKRATGPPGSRPATMAEKRSANWQRIIGKEEPHERTIDADIVGESPVRALRDDLREQGGADVGGGGPKRLASGLG
jgi:hypothetical protein